MIFLLILSIHCCFLEFGVSALWFGEFLIPKLLVCEKGGSGDEVADSHKVDCDDSLVRLLFNSMLTST